MRIVPVELIETTTECEYNKQNETSELHDVKDHATQRDLKRTEMRIDGEYVDKLKRAEHVRNGEYAFTDQSRIPWVPFFSIETIGKLIAGHFLLHDHERDKFKHYCGYIE